MKRSDSLSLEDSHPLSQAEFKGTVIEALKNIRADIQDLKNDIKDIRDEKRQKGLIDYAVTVAVAAIAGVLASFVPKS